MICRNEWIIWLMGLPRTAAKNTDPGLVLIQIDGLSREQLDRAIEEGRMPFLKKMIQKESYRNHRLYSGLPASTPGVQAELYYGHRTAVPAFGFRNHETGRLDRMFESHVATRVEAELSDNTQGLLTGGSSYCNIYGGGAKEQHYCATSFGWSEFFQAANPFKIILFLVLHFWMFVRVFTLLIFEFLMAIGGFFRGILSGRNFFQELLMIPARVIVVVLLRELITICACSDVARGVPVVHLNYLGYDEQAHRRGPKSWFARWALRAIDRSIKRIWKSAHRGTGLDYDLWIFSDHGQEHTEPYQFKHGKLVQEEVARIVDEFCHSKVPCDQPVKARLPSRANWLGLGGLVTIFFGEQDHDMQHRSPNVQTVTSGDLGFVYLLSDEAKNEKELIARRLVDESDVPMVAVGATGMAAKVVTSKGVFQLPEDAEEVFNDSLYKSELAADLIRMVHHVDSGEMILIGWGADPKTLSFVIQNGAHAGPGPDETDAFALIPNDIAVGDPSQKFLRPNDIRIAALQFLGREIDRPKDDKVYFDDPEIKLVPTPETPVPSRKMMEPLSILTYNVHACVGMDGELSARRIARVIGQSEANVICLQEVDVNRKRSGHRDQVHEIARFLEMDHVFFPAWHIEEEKFGNAILSKFPIQIIDASGLHHHKADRSRRSALWASVDLGEFGNIQVVNTHLSIFPKERLIQSKELLEKWIQPAHEFGPVVLCGDFNALPGGKTHKTFSGGMMDVESFTAFKTKPTYFSPYPMARLDHIFVTSELVPETVRVIDTRLAKIASDHRPLMVTLNLKTRMDPRVVNQLHADSPISSPEESNQS